MNICRWTFWRLKIKLLSTLDSRILGFPWQWRTDILRDKIWSLQTVIDSLFKRQGKVLWENELFNIQRMWTHKKKSLKKQFKYLSMWTDRLRFYLFLKARYLRQRSDEIELGFFYRFCLIKSSALSLIAIFIPIY